MINPSQNGKVDPFILGILGLSALVVAAVLIFTFQTTPENKMTTYETTQSERPKIKIESTNIDLGTMKVSDTRNEEISIENTGKKPLQITNVSTSCGCTSAQLVINGKESPVFSMHGNPPWIGEIAPGEKATLKAIYEPSKMPVQGEVERTIFFKTNDPENDEVKINIKVKVN
jgi:hypothetical protein